MDAKDAEVAALREAAKAIGVTLPTLRSWRVTERDSGAVRLVEIVGVLSLAADVAMGQAMGWALRSCLLATRFADELGLPADERSEAYYLALLRFAGCTADAHVSAAILGDEIAARTWMTGVWYGSQPEMLGAMVRHAGRGVQPWRRAIRLATTAAGMPKLVASLAAHCEVADLLAERLGFGPRLREALRQGYERWDGRGAPRGVRGAAIARPMRVVQLAHEAELFRQAGGAEGQEVAVAMLRRHSGAHDPALVERFCRSAPALMADLETEATWERVMAAEPAAAADSPAGRWLDEPQLDAALEAIADFVDLASPYTTGHSRGVAALAAGAARASARPVDVGLVRRAALVHDLGRVAVSSGVWTKQGRLTDGEWERVRLHAYFTERLLARPQPLARLAAPAALHHERLDGSGYHRAVSAAALPPEARLLAAADVYHALTEPRPHREALRGQEAVAALRNEAKVGRLDAAAVDSVLAAAGHRVRPARAARPAGLTDREVEVLRLVARGWPNRRMAQRLSISERTVQHHVEHIFDKLGVSSRAAATLLAMQHHLVTADALADGSEDGREIGP